MSYNQWASASEQHVVGEQESLPPRGALSRKDYYRLLSTQYKVVPGTRAYSSMAKEFMPLQVGLGHSLSDPDSIVEWRPGHLMNGFIMVVGASGSGKTQALKQIGSQLVLHGVPVLVLDFHGDLLFSHVHSLLMSSGMASSIGINPMEVDRSDPARQGLYDQRQTLVSMLRRAVPTLSSKQQTILAEAIRTAYIVAGIEDDYPGTWGRRPPTFADVSDILSSWLHDIEFRYAHSSIGGCIAALQAVFGHPIYGRNQNFSISSILTSNTRLDLSALDDGAQFIVAESILRMVFRVLKARGPFQNSAPDLERFRLFVIIDEASILTRGKGDPDSRNRILNVLASEGRKFGLGLVLASQMSDHFGRDVQCSFSKRLIMGTSDIKEAKKNAEGMGISGEDILNLGGKGCGYFCGGRLSYAEKMQVYMASDESQIPG